VADDPVDRAQEKAAVAELIERAVGGKTRVAHDHGARRTGSRAVLFHRDCSREWPVTGAFDVTAGAAQTAGIDRGFKQNRTLRIARSRAAARRRSFAHREYSGEKYRAAHAAQNRVAR